MTKAIEEINFLRQSDYVTAYRRDPDRVWDCLRHRSLDVRIAAVKCLVHFATDPIVSQIITTLATFPSWKNGGTYPAARLLAPHISVAQDAALIDAFPNLAIRDETAYQILCQRCPSRKLQQKLESVLFAADSDPETCRLAIVSITAVSGPDQRSLWERCVHHKFKIVSNCAQFYLQQHWTG